MSGDPLLDRLIRCCVRVTGAETGSGFFVAPGWVLTCAHVVGQKPPPEIFVEHGGAKLPAKLLELHPDKADDLALLEVAAADEPGVWLDDEALLEDRLVVFGFPAGVGTSRTVRYEGKELLPGGALERFHHQFKAGQIIPGFSGSPLLNQRTGRVIGVVTETRGKNTDLGGFAVPVGHARRVLANALPIAAARSDWTQALQQRERLVDRALVVASGRERALPFANAIERFISDYRRSPFGGRKRQLEHLDRWLDEGGSPYALVAAPGGRGKSALVVRWLEELSEPGRSSPRVVFVPVSVRYKPTSENDVFRALVARLEEVYGDAGQRDDRRPNERDRFAGYLRREPPAGARLLVVVDALDEADGWDVGPDLFPEHPAPGIKVLVTARVRADRSARSWLERLGWAPEVPCIELPNLSLEDTAGLLQRSGPPLAERALSAAYVALVHGFADDGDPLVLSLLIPDLIANPDLIRGTRRPRGLDSYFDWWWKTQQELWGDFSLAKDAGARHVFNLLATALGPLPRADLLALVRRLRADFSGDELDEALARLTRFVVQDPEHQSLVLTHPLFGEHRFERLRRDGDHVVYESAFLDWGRATFEAWRNGPPAQTAPYIVHHCGAHLERAGAGALALLALVGPVWKAASDAFDDDYNGYYQDVARAARACRASGGLEGDEWRCAYELSERKSFAEGLHPRMLGSLLQHGLWSGRRCLTFIQQLDQPEAARQGLAAVFPHLGEALLADAERLLERTADKDSLWAARAAAAYSLRLRTIDRERAREYARNRSHLARGLALVTLAAEAPDGGERSRLLLEAFDLTGLDWLSVHRLLAHFEAAFARFGSDPEWVTAGLEPETRREAQGRVLDFVAGRVGAPVTIAALHRPRDFQYLELLLPLSRRAEAAACLVRLLDGIAADPKDLHGVDAIAAVARFVPPPQLDRAIEVATLAAQGRVECAGPLAFVLSALAPSLTAERRALLTPALLGADLFASGSVDDRRELVERLGRLGLADQVIAKVEDQRSAGARWQKEIIDALLPSLDLGQVERLLAIDLASEVRCDVFPAMRARLADFGRAHTQRALSLREATMTDRPGKVAAGALALCLEREPTEGLLAWLAQPCDVDLRLAWLTVLAPRLGPRLSPAQFCAATDVLSKSLYGGEVWEAEVLLNGVALLAAHLSPECARAVEVREAYERLPMANRYCVVPDGYYASFCRRLVAVGARDAALALARGARRPRLEALAVIPDLPEGIIPARLGDSVDDRWGECAELAAVRGTRGDQPWRQALAALMATVEPAHFSKAHSRRLARVLDLVPAEVAEVVFRATFAAPEWLPRMQDTDVLRDLARYFPEPWLDALAPERLGGGSSTDRSHCRAVVAVRLAALGRGGDALAWMQSMPYGAMAPEYVARAIDCLPSAALPEWVAWSLDELPYGERYPTIWRALAARWATMPEAEARALYRVWLDFVGRRPRRYALRELPGFVPGIERLSADGLTTVHGTIRVA